MERPVGTDRGIVSPVMFLIKIWMFDKCSDASEFEKAMLTAGIGLT